MFECLTCPHCPDGPAVWKYIVFLPTSKGNITSNWMLISLSTSPWPNLRRIGCERSGIHITSFPKPTNSSQRKIPLFPSLRCIDGCYLPWVLYHSQTWILFTLGFRNSVGCDTGDITVHSCQQSIASIASNNDNMARDRMHDEQESEDLSEDLDIGDNVINVDNSVNTD